MEEAHGHNSADNNSTDDEDRRNSRVMTNRNSKPGGYFSEDEEMLIARMFRLVGERWGLIAGRIPGRTAEEIENYWTTKYGR